MAQQVVLITGCSSGIGRALAEEFHRRGHLVYATGRKIHALQALAELGMRVLPLDVTDRASIDAALAVVRTEQGRLDMLVNNAGTDNTARHSTSAWMPCAANSTPMYSRRSNWCVPHCP